MYGSPRCKSVVFKTLPVAHYQRFDVLQPSCCFYKRFPWERDALCIAKTLRHTSSTTVICCPRVEKLRSAECLRPAGSAESPSVPPAMLCFTGMSNAFENLHFLDYLDCLLISQFCPMSLMSCRFCFSSEHESAIFSTLLNLQLVFHSSHGKLSGTVLACTS
jgi:hypothetical protein